MTLDERLEKMSKLNLKIDTKIQELVHLKALAEKTTSYVTGMPGNSNKAKRTMADTIDKIVDLQYEINNEIDEYVDIKSEMYHAINKLEDSDQRLVLEMRYINEMKWQEIAGAIGCADRHVYRIHEAGIKNLKKFFECQ